MASLGLGFSLQVALPAAVFGYEATPPFARHDQMREIASSPGAVMAGMRAVESAGVLMLEPQPWLLDQMFGQYSFPAGSNQNWTTALNATYGKQFLTLPDVTADTLFTVVTLATLSANSAFYAVINRGDPGTGATLDAQHVYTELIVGANAAVPVDVAANGNLDYSAGVPVRLVFQLGRPPFLQGATVVDGAWVFSPSFGENGVVATDAGMATEQLLAVNNRSLFVEWLPLPDQNQLVVSIRGLSKPLVLRFSQTDGYPIQIAAGNVQLAGMNGSCGFALFPMRFAPEGSYTSPTIEIPFVYQGNGEVVLYEASQPPGCSLTATLGATDDTGNFMAYEVAMTGPVDDSGLASSSPTVQQIGVYLPPTMLWASWQGGSTDLTEYIEDIEEEAWFDPEALTIRSQVRFRLTNAGSPYAGIFGGVQRLIQGYFSGQTGGVHLAGLYSRWLTVDEGDGPQAYSPPAQFLLGWAGMETSVSRSDPTRTFDFVLKDGLFPHEVKQVGDVGFLDGWCWLRAIGFLAELGGRTDGFIDPMLLQCALGPNPQNCPHLKLPLGTGDSPAMGFHPEMTFLACMQEIASFGYGVLWADTGNILRLLDYRTLVYAAPFLGTFTTNGEDVDGNDPLSLSQMWRTAQMTVDTSDRRTAVLDAGIDPATNQVFGAYIDADDFFGVPGLTALVEGFTRPLIQLSRRFVDPVFTQSFAEATMMRIFRPTVTTTNEACFLPGMYPLMQYALQESGFLVDGMLALSCERVLSRWSVGRDGKVSMGSQVWGRSIYNV